MTIDPTETEPDSLDTPGLSNDPFSWNGRSVSLEPATRACSAYRLLQVIKKLAFHLLAIFRLNMRSIIKEKTAASFCFSIEGIRQPEIQIAGINGINTSEASARCHAEYLASLSGHRSIDWVYNHSHGPITDVSEVFLLNLGGASPVTAALLQKNWMKFHEENASRPNAKYLQFCHSQGALHVRNALAGVDPNIQKRILVVAIAPAVLIPKQACFQAFHYASKKDLVRWAEFLYAGGLDPNECLPSRLLESAIKEKAHLVLLPPHPEAIGIDHDFQSPTFREILLQHIRGYTEKC